MFAEMFSFCVKQMITGVDCKKLARIIPPTHKNNTKAKSKPRSRIKAISAKTVLKFSFAKNALDTKL